MTRVLPLAVVLAWSAAAQPAARITVLFDDTGPMAAGWGYSALIEAGGRRILFDTGGSGALLERNVKALGVDLRRLDAVILSHRHDDHIQGASYVLKVNPAVKVYVPLEEFGVFGTSPLMVLAPYLPPRLRPPSNPVPRAVRISGPTEILPGVRIVVTSTSELTELTLVVRTSKGSLLVSGCSHAGIETVLQAAGPGVTTIAGGLHLINANPDEIDRLIPALKSRWQIQTILPGHCTGLRAIASMQRIFGTRCIVAGAGQATEL